MCAHTARKPSRLKQCAVCMELWQRAAAAAAEMHNQHFEQRQELRSPMAMATIIMCCWLAASAAAASNSRSACNLYNKRGSAAVAVVIQMLQRHAKLAAAATTDALQRQVNIAAAATTDALQRQAHIAAAAITDALQRQANIAAAANTDALQRQATTPSCGLPAVCLPTPAPQGPRNTQRRGSQRGSCRP